MPLLTRSSRRGCGLCCKADDRVFLLIKISELPPAVSASYCVLLLGGGLFAYSKSGSKNSLFGGLIGSVLMASLQSRRWIIGGASKQFLAALKVLARVHHVNLVEIT